MPHQHIGLGVWCRSQDDLNALHQTARRDAVRQVPRRDPCDAETTAGLPTGGDVARAQRRCPVPPSGSSSSERRDQLLEHILGE